MSKHPLTQYREARGLTMKAFSALIGVQPAAVSRWEAGDRFPRPDQMARISAVTEGAVTADHLVASRGVAA